MRKRTAYSSRTGPADKRRLRIDARLQACIILACGLIMQAFPLELELDFSDSSAMGDPLPSILLRVTDEAYGYNIKGLDALDKGMLEGAIGFFQNALDLLPAYSDAENNIGVAYFRRGNISRAREIWQGIIRKDAGYAIAYYNLGIASYHEKDFGAAFRSFEAALKSNRNFFQAMVMLGKVRLETGDIREAVRVLRKAYEINSADRSAWSMYAFALLQSGDTSRARSVLLARRRDSHALQTLGKMEASRGDTDKAKQYLREAAAAGEDASVLLDLAMVLSESGPCTEALRTLESYFTLAPHPVADAWILAGVEAKECGEIARSRQFFEKGLASYPGDPLIRFNLGQIYFYEKEYDRAMSTWSGLADTLNDPSLFHLQSLVAHKKSDLESAERLIRKAIALDGRKAEYCDFLGIVLHEKGDDADAKRWFKKALEINPALQSAQMHYAVSAKSGDEIRKAIEQAHARIASCDTACVDERLEAAILHYHAGDLPKSLALLEQIPESEKDIRIYRHLALFYRMQHDWDRAIECLQTARKNFVVEPQIDYELVECYMGAGLYPQATVLLAQLVSKRHEDAWRLNYQLGYACLEQNRLDDAERYLSRSIDLKKDCAPAQGLLAFVYNRKGRSEDARRLWEQTLAADPSNHVLWINMGLALEAQGNYEKALEKYSRAASLNPSDNSVQINIGNVYAAVGRHCEALEAFQKALGSQKRENAAYNAFVAACRLDNMEKARDMLKILTHEYPASENTMRAHAEMLVIQKDTTKSLSLFEGLKEKNENDWFALARIYLARGEGEKGEDALRHIPADSVWNKSIIQLRAETAFAGRQYSKALELWNMIPDTSFSIRYNTALAALHCKEFERAFEIAQSLALRSSSETAADAYGIAAAAALGLRRWEESVQWYRKLLQINGGDGAAMYNLAVALYNLGDSDDAWKYYSRAKVVAPELSDSVFEKRFTVDGGAAAGAKLLDSLDEMYNSAVRLQTGGDDTAAERIYLRIIERNPRYNRAYNNLGAIYAAAGRLRDAEKQYKRALEKDNGYVEAYANLVGIYIAQRDFRQARRWLQKGMMHNPDNKILIQTKDSLDSAMSRGRNDE